MRRGPRAARVAARQFALAVAIVVAPVLIALVVVGSLMVVSDRGAALVAAIVAAAGLVAVVAARLVAGGILHDVQAIRDGLAAVGAGQRDVRIETSADDELRRAGRRGQRDDRSAARGGGAPRPVRSRAAGPGRGGVPRSAHADHLAAAARRGDRRRHRRGRRDPPRLSAADGDPHRRAERADR